MAAITASASAVAPAPPSAQWLHTIASIAPLFIAASFINSNSDWVSVLK